MQLFSIRLGLVLATIALAGCVPEALVPSGDQESGVLDTVLAATENSPEANDNAADSYETPVSDDAPPPSESSRTFSGSVSGSGDYRLFELGGGSPGDEWVVSLGSTLSGPFVVVLLDAEQNLLMRSYMSYHNPLEHVLRAASGHVYLGVMAPMSGGGGDFELNASFNNGQRVAAPVQQVVWLNFGSGNRVQVHHRDPISFAPFDAAMVGEAYAGHTQEIKDHILEEMRADYAAYNVVILNSDDGPPPEGSHSVIHFGGSESGLLGLADNVDDYNQDLAQNAIIYVENFAPYWTMQLEPDEMAVMIANVASHELGHLLGLYHTRDPDDLMDTTGSAWDLAENQSFSRGPLEPSVFATGWEDSPCLLKQIVGPNPDGAKSTSRAKSAKELVYRAIRRFAQEELDRKKDAYLRSSGG